MSLLGLCNSNFPQIRNNELLLIIGSLLADFTKPDFINCGKIMEYLRLKLTECSISKLILKKKSEQSEPVTEAWQASLQHLRNQLLRWTSRSLGGERWAGTQPLSWRERHRLPAGDLGVLTLSSLPRGVACAPRTGRSCPQRRALTRCARKATSSGTFLTKRRLN